MAFLVNVTGNGLLVPHRIPTRLNSVRVPVDGYTAEYFAWSSLGLQAIADYVPYNA
jgi:hypothetical protein